MIRFAGASFIALGSATLACASSSFGTSSAPDASGALSCSDGPPVGDRASLPNVADIPDTVECTPRCDYDTKQNRGDWYLLAAIPSGACSTERACHLRVYDGCGHQGVQCACVTGQWSCGIASRARVACVDADAGADASND